MEKIIAIALDFGSRDPYPSASNWAIAYLVRADIHQLSHLSAQEEVVQALELLKCRWDFVVTKSRTKSDYLTTLQCLKKILDNWKARGIDPKQHEIWIYCHTIQASAIRMMLGQKGLVIAREITTKVYDPRSHQWWTQNPLFAWFEKIRRGLIHLKRGEINPIYLFKPPQR